MLAEMYLWPQLVVPPSTAFCTGSQHPKAFLSFAFLGQGSIRVVLKFTRAAKATKFIKVFTYGM